MRRLLGPLLTALLVAGVGYAIYRSVGSQLAARRVVNVRGVIGSEKEAFFSDPRVQAALKKKGFAVQVDKAGSRQIATAFDLNGYDFAFPSGVPAAEKLRRAAKAKTTYDVFYTPMAVASWMPILKILAANGLATERAGYGELDLPALLDVMEAGKRWRDLKASGAYAVPKSVLLSSTDVRTSNSAAMYLALASYVENGEAVVQDGAQADRVLPKVAGLFLRQGYQDASSAGPFEDYLTIGMGKTPLVMVYESQFVENAGKKQLRPGMVLLYPKPTVFTKHVLVPLSDAGARLGEALSTDPELQKLAAENGFRTRDPAAFAQVAGAAGLQLPGDLVDVVDPPNYEVIERLISGIERQYP